DEQAAIADRGARHGDTARIIRRMRADLHLDPGAAVALDPAAELILELAVAICREATAAIDRHGVAPTAEQQRQRPAEQLGLEIPQRRVDSGDGAGRKPLASEIAHAALHRNPG